MSSRLDSIDFHSLAARISRFDAEELAQGAATGMRQLQRHFRARYGVSPQQWLNAKRLERARQMLASGMVAKVVAIELGFRHQSYFSTVFRKHHGYSPRDIKKQTHAGTTA